jgi:SAM-dependent methyltransferase
MGLPAKKPAAASEANPVLERRRARNGNYLDIENVKGTEWQSWPRKRREDFVGQAVRYWRRKGFPYYALTRKEIQRELQWLKVYDYQNLFAGDEILSSNLGLRLANNFHPQMWHVRCTRYRSPFETFSDDRKLAQAIHRSLSIWADRRGANGSCLRRMLKSFSNTVGVSNFRPTVAAGIVQRYTPPKGRVLDFSAGYGGRLLGAHVTGRSYYGIDPSPSQVKGLRKMAAACRRETADAPSVAIHRAAAETALPLLRARSVDLVFSSPPYFDREKYGSEQEQSWVRYSTLEEWREGFMRRVIEQSARLLATDGYLVLNVAERPDSIAQMALEIARPLFVLERTWRMRLANLPYKRLTYADVYKWEPVLVFKKRVVGSRSTTT